VVAERLAAFNQRPRSLEEIELQQPFTERVLRPFIRQLADALSRFQQARSKQSRDTQVKGMEAIQRKLALAGNPYRWTPADYLGMKAFAALVIGGLLFFMMTLGGEAGWAIIFGATGVAFGWFGPDLLLRSKTQARQKQIQRALPDALDLLVISVEAGLGFDAAIHRLVEKREDALSTEFARVLAEMRVGRSRRDALKDLVLRTQVPDLNNFVGAILQAEQLGVSVTRVLTVQADQMRVLRRQRAEEKAAQLQLKMIFPLAIFIFPALCVVIMGPIWPTMARTNAPGL
jgi:tight adherence protein C